MVKMFVDSMENHNSCRWPGVSQPGIWMVRFVNVPLWGDVSSPICFPGNAIGWEESALSRVASGERLCRVTVAMRYGNSRNAGVGEERAISLPVHF